MPNKKQRMQNRENARMLASHAVICPECGERGKHFIQWPPFTLEDQLMGLEPKGFWTCRKFYDENGVRKAEIPNEKAMAPAEGGSQRPEGAT